MNETGNFGGFELPRRFPIIGEAVFSGRASATIQNQASRRDGTAYIRQPFYLSLPLGEGMVSEYRRELVWEH